jgi:putative transposase
MPKPPQRPADPKQHRKTFVRNHARAIIACDFFVVMTATFQMVYVFFIMEIGRWSSFENVLLARMPIRHS